jgi:hypothetical protein
MKATIGAAVLAVLATLASLAPAAEQQTTPAAAHVPEVWTGPVTAEAAPAAVPAAPPVPMVELVLRDGTVVTGRLVKDDGQTVQVASFGGSTIGYNRDLIESMRRYTLPASGFAEQAGDYQAGQLWKAADGAAVYARAREQYQQALLLAATADERDRVQAKVAALDRERDALQAEALRHVEVQKANDEAEAVRLQKQLTQQQIAALQALSPRLQQMEQDLRQTKQAILALQDAADANNRSVVDLGSQLAKVQDDLTTLENNVVYAPYPVYFQPVRPRDDGRRGGDSRGDDRGEGEPHSDH